MNRNRRLAYLAEMGIETWVPRQALVGAAQGHWIAPAALNPSQTVSANCSASSAANTASAEPRQGQKVIVNRGLAIAEVLNLNDDAKKSSSQRQANQSVAQQAPELTAAAEPSNPATATPIRSNSLQQFTLASSVCGDILLVDDISAMSFASSAYQNWINAILLSLGKLPGDKPLMSTAASQLDRFEWPLADSGMFESTEQAAKEIVSAWLLRKLQENSVNWVLLMGKASIAMLANSSDQSHTQALGSIVSLPGSNSKQALLTHGSAELWEQPLLKRDFWQHLQALTLPTK